MSGQQQQYRHRKKVVHVKRYTIVHIIFFLIIIYMIVCIGRYAMREHIQFYEVTSGKLTSDPSYTGLILRDESVVNSAYAGYLKCYLHSGDRVAANKAVYAVGESGDAIALARTSEQSKISEDDLTQLRSQLKNFSVNYDADNYADVYSFKDQLQAALYEIEISASGEPNASDGGVSNIGLAEASGIVVYAKDGCENLKPEQVTGDLFSNTNLEKTYSQGAQVLQKGDFVYKLIKGREWRIVIPVSQEEADSYATAGNVKVRLSDIGVERSASVSVVTGADSGKYAVLTLNRYLESYTNDRYIKIEIVKDRPEGLKIPKSSLTSKDFYVIPEAFMTNNDKKTVDGFYLPAASEDEKPQFVTPKIHGHVSGFYFIDDSDVQPGMVIKHPKSNDTYTINDKQALAGVYNINKGYVIFEGVAVLDENNEYSIVKDAYEYGLSAFDHIVLNAATVNDEEILYE